MVELLRKIGFAGGDSDPFLFVRKNKLGICYIAIYVDDNLMIHHEVTINERKLLDRAGRTGSQS